MTYILVYGSMKTAVIGFQYVLYFIILTLIVFVTADILYSGKISLVLKTFNVYRLMQVIQQIGFWNCLETKRVLMKDYHVSTPTVKETLAWGYRTIIQLVLIFPLCELLNIIQVLYPKDIIREILRLVEIISVIGVETTIQIIFDDVGIFSFHKIIRTFCRKSDWTILEIINHIGYLKLMNILVFRIRAARVATIKKLISDDAERFDKPSGKPWPKAVYDIQRDLQNLYGKE